MKTVDQKTVIRFWRDERAATAVEYSLIAAGIASVLVVTIGALGGNVKTMWNAIKNALGS